MDESVEEDVIEEVNEQIIDEPIKEVVAGKAANVEAMVEQQPAPSSRLSFNDIDYVQSQDGAVSNVNAPKNISRLEEISSVRAQQRKQDEEEDDDDSPKLQISTQPFNLDALDIHNIEEPSIDLLPDLLIDEIDRADDEFEAYLLEVLSDFQITVPEVGTFTATTPPIVILTSNRTRDVHDALKRRCLYHWVEHPGFEREVDIVKLRVPQASETLARQVAGAVEALRGINLYKPPGVAETIDWATALGRLGVTEINEQVVEQTLGTVLKYREDQTRVRDHGIAGVVQHAFERGLLHG